MTSPNYWRCSLGKRLTQPNNISNAQERTSIRLDVAFQAYVYRSNRLAYSLHLPSLLSKISPHHVLLCSCARCCCLPRCAPHLAPRGSPIQRCAPSHVAPLHRRARLHPLPRPLQRAAPPLVVHRTPYPACAEVLLTPPFPTRRLWPLSKPWPSRCATSTRRCCD